MRARRDSVGLIYKPLVFGICLIPLATLILRTFEVGGLSLGANPVEALLHGCGLWGLRLMLVTLAVTPLRRWTGWHSLIRFRRMLGLFAFFYIVLHFCVYLLLDQQLAWGAIVEDVVERPYITLGMTGLLLLIPLAVTSTNRMMRRLGRRWQTLHRLVYVIGILGVWHFWWQVKLDAREPLVYAVLLSVLLGARIVHASRRRTVRGVAQPRPTRGPAPQAAESR